jgi:hypothetical protein
MGRLNTPENSDSETFQTVSPSSGELLVDPDQGRHRQAETGSAEGVTGTPYDKPLFDGFNNRIHHCFSIKPVLVGIPSGITAKRLIILRSFKI